ncbi:hypothetical protein GQX74_001910 [Glossina fuscipes]|nr:hypothetical protein GQX74_001910 [Glossina fuscipes]
MSTDWPNQQFRQNVTIKIKDLLPNSVGDPAKNAVVMEDHIFSNTKSREDYLNLLDKLYLHFMNMPSKGTSGI